MRTLWAETGLELWKVRRSPWTPCTPLPASLRSWADLAPAPRCLPGIQEEAQGPGSVRGAGQPSPCLPTPSIPPSPGQKWAGKRSSPCRWCYVCNAAKASNLWLRAFLRSYKPAVQTVKTSSRPHRSKRHAAKAGKQQPSHPAVSSPLPSTPAAHPWGNIRGRGRLCRDHSG